MSQAVDVSFDFSCAKTVEAKGFIFVGGLFLSSRQVAWRGGFSIQEKVLEKLDYVIRLANKERLIPFFLGNIFARAHETDDELKILLMRKLREIWTPAWCSIGKNDKSEATLCDKDSLTLLAEAGVLSVAIQDGGAIIAENQGFRLGVGVTNYGSAIPAGVQTHNGPDGEAVNGVVWVCHRPLSDGAPSYIPGVNLVLDAENVYETPPLGKRDAAGEKETRWMSIGAITRIREDMAKVKPCVWLLTREGFSRHGVPHEEIASPDDGLELMGTIVQRGGERNSFVSGIRAIRTGTTRANEKDYALKLVINNIKEENEEEKQKLIRVAKKLYDKALLKAKAK